MLQNRNLSNNDKKRLLLLATQEIEKADASLETMEPNSTEKKIREVKNDAKTPSKLTPKDTASFLSLFNDPNGFKFLTHDFDPDSEMNYDKLMEQVKKVFREKSKPTSLTIPPSLWNQLEAFINGGKGSDGKVRTWRDDKGVSHQSGYYCEEWIEWANKNPNNHLLSNEEIGKEILTFRSSIRLVKPILCDIIKEQENKHHNLKFQTINLQAADFYTFVWYLKSGIQRILDDMERYANKTPNVKISFDRSFGDDYSKRIIKITQLDSFSSSIDDVIKKYKSGGGAFNEIMKFFIGYCNWSVESLWDGKAQRWNILRDLDVDEIENMEDTNVPGFTHILTYFSK